MRFWPRLPATTLALAAGLSVGYAQTNTQSNPALELTAQQRAAIYQTITKQKVYRPPPPMQLAVGADVPPSTELYPMPDNVVAELPATSIYKYTVVQNQVVIVDPTILKVVDVIRQ